MSSIDRRETWLYRSTLGAFSDIGDEDDTLSIREGIIEINEEHLSRLSVESCHNIAHEDMPKKTKENLLNTYTLVPKENFNHTGYSNYKTPPAGTSTTDDFSSGPLYWSLFSSNALLYSLVLLSKESIYFFLDLSSFPPSSVFLIASIAAGLFCFIGGIMGDHTQQRLVMLNFSFALVSLSSLSFLCSIFIIHAQEALKMLSLLLWITGYGLSVPNLEVIGIQEAAWRSSSVPKTRIFIYYFASSTMVASVFQTILSLGKMPNISLLNAITCGLYVCVATLLRIVFLRLDKPLAARRKSTTSAFLHVKCLMSRKNIIYATLSLSFVTVGSIGTIMSLSIKEDKKIVSITQTRGRIAAVSFGLIFSGWLVMLLLTLRRLCVRDNSNTVCKLLGSCIHDMTKVTVLKSIMCVVVLTAFIRAQLSMALSVQICQTDLIIPGAKVTSTFLPDLATAVFEVVSLVVSGGLLLLNFRLKRVKNLLECGVLLYVVASFVSSIVELYRRSSKIRVVAVLNRETLGWFPERCATVSSEVSFLWAIPYLVMFAIANSCFRIHVQEIMYDFSQASTWAREWTGTAMGLLYLTHSVGYLSAFSLSNAISSWLFHQGGSDSVVYLLITTTIASLTYAVNKKIVHT